MLKPKLSIGAIIARVLLVAILIGFTVMTIYPIIWLIINSFKTSKEFQMNRLGLPIAPTFINYPQAWKIGNFSMLFVNSIFYTGVATLAIVILSLSTSFAFAKIQSKATKPLYNSFVIGILLALESIMVPLFIMSIVTGVYDTRIGILIPYIGLGLPIGVYLGTEFIKSIPDALIESARLEGASYLRIFFSIILPMCIPVAMTLAILTVTSLWNEFMLVNILASRESLKSLPVGILKFSGSLASDYGKQFAALVIGMLPMLIFYLSFRKQIQRGLAAGAVKG
ncbi:MAG: carbohydrate ABC transporter permease [Spirochaetes bacterium]|nr:carbohydrate ABC transporter permease [Spirochaetota bacterium]MBU0956650.1 carbohydrate ABC transporter permease [Spirochaetota bacterium]